MGEEATGQSPDNRSPRDPGTRLDAVVSELDSLLEALGNTDTGERLAESTPTVSSNPRSAPPPPRSGHSEPDTTGAHREMWRVDDVSAAGERTPAAVPSADPSTQAPPSHIRRWVVIASVLVAATAIAYAIGSTLGALVDSGGRDETAETEDSMSAIEIVTNRFEGPGTVTTDWFTPVTEFRAVWTEPPAGTVEVTLETQEGVTTVITPEHDGDDSVFIPSDTYRLTVTTEGAWMLHLVRVVDG